MRGIGLILIFLGAILLLQQFHPALLDVLYRYEEPIRRAFWGVTLIAAGLYLSFRRLRRVVLILYILYLLVYLVV
ncbi:hypothetical protein [Thermococcus sp.]|uniref:hypothetical protein n=1 Tax=Thermococcus sp. TaxID=35749 RepID=UPI00262A077B|nr:hypothetical protein [Thermococcus sp.]